MVEVLDRIWSLGVGYVAAGALAAIALHAIGLPRIDPAVRGAGVTFRLLITPGMIALWPWLVVRWIRAKAAGAPPPPAGPRPASLRSTHRVLAVALAVAIPIALGVALATRPAAVVSTELPIQPAAQAEE